MSKLRDRTEFLAHDPLRVRVAELCEQESLTRPEIAAKLDREPGGLSTPDTMLTEGALVDAGAKPNRRRGPNPQALKFNPNWRMALAAARQRLRPAELTSGGDLLIVALTETQAACRVLAVGSPDFAWGMELSGDQSGMLLATAAPDTAGSTIRAAAALNAAGVNPVRLRLGTPMAPAELREWARDILKAERRTLTPGS